MIKKFFSALFVVLVATSIMAQTGLTCEDPIPVDENYVATVDGPCTLWYVANTFDLPLSVYFSPFSENSTISPIVEVDFTCTPGVYNDPKLDSLINVIQGFDVEFPVMFMCDLVVRDGKNEWDLSIDKKYREQMTEFGITYNVQALVKVTFFEGGEIRLKPDDFFKNCFESSEYINLGDTIEVLPNDVERVFVVSYSEWQNDSIRFVWKGEDDARVWVASPMCEFEPSLLDPMVWNHLDLSSDSPLKMYSQEMKDAIKTHGNGGLYYGKVISSKVGKLVVEKIPANKPLGDAILLEYGVGTKIMANDTNTLYCFPKNWTSTQFAAPTAYGVEMYVSNQPDFAPIIQGANVLESYKFDSENSAKALYLSSKEIANLRLKAVDDYIYVRFRTASTTIITPSAWITNGCLENTVQLEPNVVKIVPANSSNIVYRLRYQDFEGYDMTIKWNGSRTLSVYMADISDFRLSNSGPNILLYQSVNRRSSVVVPVSVVSEWASRVDEDGYVYVCLDATVGSGISFITEKPVEEDPVITTNECVESSIKLNIGDQLTLNLNNAFTVYCINYAEWAAQGATLQWTGEEPLHTFVAETCQFAVAPYNKFVHLYLPITAETALDMNALAPYVDDAGYLYIRFLTEKEGVLTIK